MSESKLSAHRVLFFVGDLYEDESHDTFSGKNGYPCRAEALIPAFGEALVACLAEVSA